MHYSTCKGCGRKIVWAIDEAGKRQCLDAVAPVYEVLRPDEVDARCARRKESFVSHFVTCPNRDQFRKPKAAKEGE